MPPTSAARIGYVLKMYPRFSETFIVNEILAHEAAGLEIEIFSLRPPADGRFHESLSRVHAPVTYLPASPKADSLWSEISEARQELPALWETLEDAEGLSARDVYQAVLLARAARSRGITHLHAHFGSVATIVARLAARAASLPYSFTAHAKDIYHESVQPADLRRKLADAAAVVTVSRYNAKHLRDTYGRAADRVCCVYNGLDLERFGYGSPALRPQRILAVGRLVEKKGFADLIDACAILAERGRPFSCQIIGTGPLQGSLGDQIERLGLAASVELIGPRPQDDVMRHMQGAAVLVAPSVVASDGNADGLPTVLLEAMALGTPCVATDVTGIPEIVRDGETGLCAPRHDPPALAAAMERLLDDGALRDRLAAAARRLMEAQFDIHRNSAQMREMFLPAKRMIAGAGRVV